ncbi:response regulator [Clostridium sp. P21]|uniref:Stage 0 sporulation protein A homolog n=1 Tax=Clostridium muellerianum TaxID=2716538 RepID=A0A7Y0EGL5_9CLOT|nr:response regulator [Clostridium muellerianum]NMM63109.1 response regulator [Clostridium muellerianum]
MNNVQVPLNNASVLIVDDSYYNIKTLTMILKHEECNVRSALSYELGLKSAVENPPDIILIRANMSNEDGYKVCEALKTYSSIKKIPIIFTSENNEIIDRDKVFSAGADDYIIMPFSYKEVLARVKTHLKLYFMSMEMEKYNKGSYDEVREFNESLVRDNNNLKMQVKKKTSS